METASFYILNVLINSFLAFVTVAFLVEGIIFLFRMQQGRLSAFLRMVPFLKLPLDLCLYDFSKWCFAQGVNPLLCEKGTRTFSVTCDNLASSMKLSVNNVTFTLADLIGYSIHPFALKVIAVSIVGITIALIIKKAVLYYRSYINLKSLTENSCSFSRNIRNQILSSCIQKHDVEILTATHLTGSPFAAGLLSSAIFFPGHLAQDLTRKEYQAVLAHELEHIRHKDGLVCVVLDLIRTVFWWVPTRWLYSRIEEGFEVGCDLKCTRYGVDRLDLASAICKSAKYSNAFEPMLAHHLTKHTIFKRLKILQEYSKTRFRKTRFIFSCLAIGMAVVIFAGKFWMF